MKDDTLVSIYSKFHQNRKINEILIAVLAHLCHDLDPCARASKRRNRVNSDGSDASFDFYMRPEVGNNTNQREDSLSQS